MAYREQGYGAFPGSRRIVEKRGLVVYGVLRMDFSFILASLGGWMFSSLLLPVVE